MGILDFFRRAPRIDAADALADFVDRNAAFLVQKGIYEYSRARAGPYSIMLMAEPTFKEEVEKSRWLAFPLGLAMVAEMIEGVLRLDADADRKPLVDAIGRLALSVFDRYPDPPGLEPDAWHGAREELAQQLAMIGLHPRKLVKDIPEPYSQRYFSLMPIHERLRGEDFPTLRNYLGITLCNIHDEFVRRVDATALRASLGLPAPRSS